jgi:hypothetical protein
VLSLISGSFASFALSASSFPIKGSVFLRDSSNDSSTVPGFAAEIRRDPLGRRARARARERERERMTKNVGGPRRFAQIPVGIKSRTLGCPPTPSRHFRHEHSLVR